MRSACPILSWEKNIVAEIRMDEIVVRGFIREKGIATGWP